MNINRAWLKLWYQLKAEQDVAPLYHIKHIKNSTKDYYSIKMDNDLGVTLWAGIITKTGNVSKSLESDICPDVIKTPINQYISQNPASKIGQSPSHQNNC